MAEQTKVIAEIIKIPKINQIKKYCGFLKINFVLYTKEFFMLSSSITTPAGA